ncbi:MAG: hypothetical protein GXO56_01850 [Chloroflexi bacterium]|nr:hypothetical protein [Chloroflexota bacterium]
MGTNVWLYFVLGLLVGWLIEWLIDWWYWRRKCQRVAVSASADLIDDLQQIRGIGPVIAKKLNDAGITTFAELAALTVTQLEEIVGEEIRRLTDEEDILRQARERAARK